MLSEQNILTTVSNLQSLPQEIETIKSKKRIGLFSIVLLIALSYNLYRWSRFAANIIHSNSDFSEFLINYLSDSRYENYPSEILLKYQFYQIPLINYTQTNIVLLICILASFPMVINFIQKNSATSIAFFQYNLNGIYIQILIMGIDLIHYFITSKCICLNSGASAVWLHLFIKVVFYSFSEIRKKNWKILLILIFFGLNLFMISFKHRVDLLIAAVTAIIDIGCLQGGTIKYPKDVFQQKQEWAQKICLNKSSFWHSFVWNEYNVNEQLCMDSFQFYVTRQERSRLINRA